MSERNSTALTFKEIATACHEWVQRNRPGVITNNRSNVQIHVRTDGIITGATVTDEHDEPSAE